MFLLFFLSVKCSSEASLLTPLGILVTAKENSSDLEKTKSVAYFFCPYI